MAGWLSNIARAGGKALGQFTPQVSIKGHKFSLNPAQVALRTASAGLQGKNVMSALDEERKAAWRSAAVAGAVAGGGALLGAGGAGAGAGTAASTIPGMTPIAAGVGGVPAAIGAAAPAAAPGLLATLGSHAGTISGALNGLGTLSGAIDARKRGKADERRAAQEAEQSDYAFQRRKRADIAMEPLRQALALQMAGSFNQPRAAVAANPYQAGR